MALSDFPNGYISVSLYSRWSVLYVDILYMLHKKCYIYTSCANKKNISNRSYVVQQNYVSYKKVCCGNEKNNFCDTQNRDSCWLYMFSVSQKRNTFFQKIVAAVYKYMLYWLKKFCVARKILWCRTKIKVGVLNCC